MIGSGLLGGYTAMDETPFRFEPAFLEGSVDPGLAGLAVDLVSASASLPGRLPAAAAAELADLVRIMNTYYSNLIEGHDTRPLDIERALAKPGTERRPFVQEALAHMAVQKEIDAAQRSGTLGRPTDVAFLKDLHRRFYDAMPSEFRMLNGAAHGNAQDGNAQDGNVQHGNAPQCISITPGAFRTSQSEDIAVGRHAPPTSARVADFMVAYERRFALTDVSAAARILAMPAAHHRLNFIHPFVDGNGRVSRLMSHAMAHRAGIGGGGLWSISRGLARGLSDRGDYKRMMDLADTSRQGERDGRGNLSERALVDFTAWFLEVAIDQVRFCARSFDLDNLDRRIEWHLGNVFRDPRHGKLVQTVLKLGEVDRGMAATILGTSERTARDILAQCVLRKFLKSDTPKGPVRVGFPIAERTWMFPALFAEDQASGPALVYQSPNPPQPGRIGD